MLLGKTLFTYLHLLPVLRIVVKFVYIVSCSEALICMLFICIYIIDMYCGPEALYYNTSILYSIVLYRLIEFNK